MQYIYTIFYLFARTVLATSAQTLRAVNVTIHTMSKTLSWQVGKVKITAITEIDDAADVIKATVPDATAQNITKIAWLVPHFADRLGNIKASVNVFVIEINDMQIIVDTGVGNFKKRPELAEWDNLETDFLNRFKLAGFEPERIDFVINTHFHFDHIGWNTMLINGEWIPTFPNARYLMVKEEFDYWQSGPKAELEDDRLAFGDSIQPIHQAGLSEFVDSDHKLFDEVLLLPTPGHTPFHVSVLIKSENSQAVIIGDVLHHPSQVANADWPCAFDTYPAKAAASRRFLLEKFADTNTLILSPHFSAPSAGYIKPDGNDFKLVERKS